MRIFLSLLITASACSYSLAQEESKSDAKQTETPKVLVGKWIGDKDKTNELHKGEAPQGMLDVIGQISITFSADGKGVMAFGEDNANIHVKETEEEGVFQVEMTKEGQEDALPGKIKLVDENTIHIMPEGEEPAAFVRKVMSLDEARLHLAGTWKGAAEETVNAAKEMGLDESMVDMMSEQIGAMTLTINDDNSYTMANSTSGDEQEGTWKLESGKVLGTFSLIADTAEGELTFSVHFIGDNMVKMQPGEDEPPAFFRKEK